jgi:hypothetical protein
MTFTEAGEILYQQVPSWNRESQFLEGPECQKSSHNDATPIHELLKSLFNRTAVVQSAFAESFYT